MAKALQLIGKLIFGLAVLVGSQMGSSVFAFSEVGHGTSVSVKKNQVASFFQKSKVDDLKLKYSDPKWKKVSRTFSSNEGLSQRRCPLRSTLIEGLDPATGKPRMLWVKEYLPRPVDPLDDQETKDRWTRVVRDKKAMIILPPTGGENLFDQWYANSFCTKGFRVLILQTWNELDQQGMDLSWYDREAFRTVVAVKQAVEYLTITNNPWIGVLGNSLGAMQASLALAFEPRISAATLIVGGFDLPGIMTETNEKTLAELREIRKKAWKLDDQGYRKKLAENIFSDPQYFFDQISISNIFIVAANQDDTVPLTYQQKLIDSIPHKKLKVLKKSHVGAISYMSLIKSFEVVEFFEDIADIETSKVVLN